MLGLPWGRWRTHSYELLTADIHLFKMLGASVIAVVIKAERGIWVDIYIAAELFYKFKVAQLG